MVRREAWRATDLRRNIRHSSGLPVQFRQDSQAAPLDIRLRDIGHGGLGVVSAKPLQPGEVFDVVFPGLDYTEHVRGEVVWASTDSGETDAPFAGGVRFVEESPYSHARLVVDVCHIEYYRRDQRQRLGRQLDYDTAVTEWKAKAGRTVAS